MYKVSLEQTEKPVREIPSSPIKMKFGKERVFMLSKSVIYSCCLGEAKELHPMEFIATHRANKVSKVESGFNRCKYTCVIVSAGAEAKKFISIHFTFFN